MRQQGMTFSLVTVGVVLCCAMAMAASPGTITGKVVDEEGAVISEAHLLFHPDESGQNTSTARQNVMRETDAAGRFDVQLEPGFYDVCVMATAFTPECKKVLITTGDTVEHDTRLKVDELVMQYLGDTFF